MPHTTTSPEGFTDHHDQAFLDTWALLEYLTVLSQVTSTAEIGAVAELSFAYEAYTENGRRRPSPGAHVSVPEGEDLAALVAALEQLLVDQLAAAGPDLPGALRLRRARDFVTRARRALG